MATSDQEKLQIRYAAIVSAAAAHSGLTFTASGQEFGGLRTGTGWFLSGNGTTVPEGVVTEEAVLDLLKSTMTVVLPKDNKLERKRKRTEAKKEADEKRSAARKKVEEEYDREEATLMGAIVQAIDGKDKASILAAIEARVKFESSGYMRKMDGFSVVIVKDGDARLASAVMTIGSDRSGELKPQISTDTRRVRNSGLTPSTRDGGVMSSLIEVSLGRTNRYPVCTRDTPARRQNEPLRRHCELVRIIF